MSASFIPNTSLASIAESKSGIYTYAQSYYGNIVEIEGKLDGNSGIYTRTGNVDTVGPTSDELPPKRFTPLAAVATRDWNTSTNRRYVFYIDGQNKLCDAYYDSKWHKGDLSAKGWAAAPYSRLAAMRLTNKIGADFICLYYQNTGESGDIVQVNYSHSGWATGPPPINDPPLFGTSLAAVLPEAGIKSASSTDDVDPVVFFQYDRLGLGSSQDLGDDDYVRYTVQAHGRALSAHSSIAAVDDGTNLWAFYTSDDNSVQRVRVDSNGTLQQPVAVGLDMAPIPGSPLTAVIFKGSSEKIILFYLLHWVSDTKSTETTNIYATTLTRQVTSGGDPYGWDVSSKVRIAL